MTRISKANKLAEDGEVDNKTLSQASQALKRWADIDVYTPSGEFREFDVIMTELAQKWNDLSDAEQANISFAIAATRQTAVLRSVLEQWSSAMNLATEAVNTNGNALANQQKYEESIAGRIQSLKTEISALWIELLDSDAIKELIDSIKELVISLEDTATGLKPVVNLLSKLLSGVAKFVSAIPATGLIGSILGLKFGKSLLSGELTKGILAWTGSIGKLITVLKGATTVSIAFAKGWEALKVAFLSNPIGWIAIGLTAATTVANLFIETLDEAKQKYAELADVAFKSKQKLDSIISDLEAQKKIVDELSDKHLTYVEQQELNKAKEMTAELERQKKVEEEIYRTTAKKAGSEQIDVWEKEGYNLDNLKSTQFALSNGNLSSEEIAAYRDDEKDIIAYYLGIETYNDKVLEDLKNVNEYLQDESNKAYYKYLTNVDRTLDETEQRWLEYYNWLQDMGGSVSKHINHDSYNESQVDNLFNNEKLNPLITSLQTALGDKIYHKEYLGQELKKGLYAPLYEAISNMDMAFESDNPFEYFWKGLVSRYNEAEEEAVKKVKSIDLATWYGDSSAVDPDKTWKEIIDSYESGLSSLGDLLNKWQSGKDVIEMKDIFDVTDVTDSIFAKFNTPAFQKYLEQAGGDVGQALANYIYSSYHNLITNIEDPELIENFDIVTDKLQKLINVAAGGANDIDKLSSSYAELIALYDSVSKGETLTTEEAARLIDKYDSLQDAVKIVGDEYSFEKDAIVNLINEYIELQNTSVSGEIVRTKQQLENTKSRLKMYGIEISMLKEVGVAAILATKSTAQEKQAVAQIIGEYLDTEKELKELEELFDSIMGDKDKYSSDSKNELDWIANSLENLARNADDARAAYDRFFSVAGSSKAAAKANTQLDVVNKRLMAQVGGFEKAASSYESELKKLGLSADEFAKVQNIALGNEPAWSIEEFAGDSKEYEKYNKAIDLYKKIMDNWKSAADTRHTILENEIQKLQNLSDVYSNAIAKYEAKLNLVGSTKKQQKYLDILIKEYGKQYAMNVAIADAKGDELEKQKLLAEWTAKENELLAKKNEVAVDNILDKYDKMMSDFEMRGAELEHGMAMDEKRGYMANQNYYKALLKNEADMSEKRLKERASLVKRLAQIEADGINSQDDLDVWWKTKNAIDDVTKSLYESVETMEDLQKAMRDLNYELFDRIQNTISGIKNETEFLVDLLRNDDPFKYVKEVLGGDEYGTKIYQGGFSEEGLAMLGLYETNYKTNIELAKNYAEKVAELNDELSRNSANVELIDKRDEYLAKQREAITAAEQEKDAIIDLIQEGYDKQLESMDTLIEKYVEALNAERELYSYQKDLSKQTKEIATLRKRMASLAGDTSEEARSRMQQLRVQLQDSQDNIQDTQWDHYISEQQNILDKMYKNFESYLNEQMEDRNARLKEIADIVDANYSGISQTLNEAANSVGTSISATMTNIFTQPLSQLATIQDAISADDTDITAIKTSVGEWRGELKNYLDTHGIKPSDLTNVGNKTDNVKTEVEKLNNNFTQEDSRFYKKINSQSKKIDAVKTTLEGIDTDLGAKIDAVKTAITSISSVIPSAESIGNAVARKIPTPPSSKDIGEDVVDAIKEYIPSLSQPHEGRYRTGYSMEHYASGARRISKNQIAWTQENGLEAIVRPSDGAILTPLSRGDSVLNAGATQNIWDMANNPIQFIRDNLSFPISLPANMSGGSYDIDQSMTLVLPNVMNYPEFVTALQNDKKFEKMLQDMTVNQLTNKNSLAKYKYKYK